ncbi:hypothetical protein PLEI_0241 [Photobacterium leiognathi lrivu.4.1]|uniref:Uncharacterized protein n=1 Tax=Photobacterium leiognathi lrivu.4.1 TaxID=1248232 RepID=V5EMN6_PHOLE|nr:hypothetical protein PLEI_0241 [Photobacterium leiognathi lrivu.4.1]
MGRAFSPIKSNPMKDDKTMLMCVGGGKQGKTVFSESTGVTFGNF